jgi:hypothetical protein
MRLADAKQETAAWALAQSTNQSAAARAAGVNRATITRWLRDPGFTGRVDELIVTIAKGESDDPSGEAERGLARLIPIAEAVVEAALKGEPFNGKAVTPQQHRNALDTIKLARSLEPKASAHEAGTMSLTELIAEADAQRS